MLKQPYQRINDIDGLIEKHGEKGIRALLLFKLLKTEVKSSLAKTTHSNINENIINKVCMQKASQLADLKKEMPTKEDVAELISKLTE